MSSVLLWKTALICPTWCRHHKTSSDNEECAHLFFLHGSNTKYLYGWGSATMMKRRPAICTIRCQDVEAAFVHASYSKRSPTICKYFSIIHVTYVLMSKPDSIRARTPDPGQFLTWRMTPKSNCLEYGNSDSSRPIRRTEMKMTHAHVLIWCRRLSVDSRRIPLVANLSATVLLRQLPKTITRRIIITGYPFLRQAL